MARPVNRRSTLLATKSPQSGEEIEGLAAAMIRIRRADERGHLDHGWLDTHHTFSFGDYYDPEHSGFRSLRVINEDWVQAGAGFGMHPHRDMEIVTYVLEGSRTHRDSHGPGSAIRAGELQRMTAGTGILHSESNDSASEPVHLYQIWLLPERVGDCRRAYRAAGVRRGRAAPRAVEAGRFTRPTVRDDSLTIRQGRPALYLGSLDAGEVVSHPLASGRHAWLQVLRGGVQLDGQALVAGDGAALSEERALTVRADQPAEVLLFDLA